MTATTVSRPTTTAHTRGNPAMQTVRDTWLIFRRSLVLTIRQPTWIVIGIMYPVIYLVLFGPLLDGAIKQAGAGVSAYNWFVPGLLIQVALFGTAFGGFGLIAELRYGVVERMRVTPMSRAAMLLGRSLRDEAAACPEPWTEQAPEPSWRARWAELTPAYEQMTTD